MIRATLLLFIICELSSGLCYEMCPHPPYNNRIAEEIVNRVEEFKSLMKTGVPELGIPVLDPLGPIPHIDLHISNKILRLKGSLSNTLILHLSDFVVCEVTIKALRIRPEFTLKFRLDKFHLQGIYDIKGFFAFIFPIYGNGNYSLDIWGACTTGSGKMTYNIFTRHAQIHGLELNVEFEKVKLNLECILGCNILSDAINSVLDHLATAIFNEFWDLLGPILTDGLEDAINIILKNMKIPFDMNTTLSIEDTKEFEKTEGGKLNFRLSLNEILKAKTTQNIN